MATVGPERRYSIFVSSTFRDLQKERQAVTSTLLEADALPTGMELFPAADEDAWSLIEKIIDECDYYMLIVAGKYGSIDPSTGLSFTEREFNYALAMKKPIMAFLHGGLENLPSSRTETDPDLRGKLESFRARVKTVRHVKYWESTEGLQGGVATTLLKFPRLYPAVGWVRGDAVASSDALTELASLRKELDSYRNHSALVVGDLDSRLRDAVTKAKRSVHIRAMNAQFLMEPVLDLLERGSVDLTIVLADPTARYFADSDGIRSLCMKSTPGMLGENFNRTVRQLEPHKDNPRLRLLKTREVLTCTIVVVDDEFLRLSTNLPHKTRRLSFQHEDFQANRHLNELSRVLVMSEASAEPVWSALPDSLSHADIDAEHSRIENLRHPNPSPDGHTDRSGV